MVNGSFCNLCALALRLALHMLTSIKKDETAVQFCEPALSALAMFVSRNVFHVVSVNLAVYCLSCIDPIR